MTKLSFTLSLLAICFSSCSISDSPVVRANFDKALENGILANEGFRRCMWYMNDWLLQADSISGLIPKNLYDGSDIWDAHNAAADNYPFMVLTSYILDKGMYNSVMLEMLGSEKQLTSRLGPIPDAYSFANQNYAYPDIDTNRLVFGVSEYIKDGLIPLTEYSGVSPWSDRMIEMLDALSDHLTVAQNFDGDLFRNPVEMEINGELLQTLSRVYWMTGNEKYLKWAIQIGDYYLLDDKLLTTDRLRLRDHGCEIIGGLSELYVALHYTQVDKKKEYQLRLYEILDRVLEIGRNDDGMFYNEVNMVTGEVLDSMIVDNWGYIYNAYYAVFLIDGKDEYREAVLKPMGELYPKYRNYDWEHGSADGFADAIESGINLYNRENLPTLANWIDSEVQVMWSLQDSSYQPRAQKWRSSGIIEGWHGDGNFARTTLMYCLWKTADLVIEPWREDVLFGAVQDSVASYIALKATEDWEGILVFGQKRHKKILNLPIDYPRINQFPEWQSVDENKEYRLIYDNGSSFEVYRGRDLHKGIKIKLAKDEERLIELVEET